MLSLLRIMALTLMRLADRDRIIATLRAHSRHPGHAVTLVTQPLAGA